MITEHFSPMETPRSSRNFVGNPGLTLGQEDAHHAWGDDLGFIRNVVALDSNLNRNAEEQAELDAYQQNHDHYLTNIARRLEHAAEEGPVVSQPYTAGDKAQFVVRYDEPMSPLDLTRLGIQLPGLDPEEDGRPLAFVLHGNMAFDQGVQALELLLRHKSGQVYGLFLENAKAAQGGNSNPAGHNRWQGGRYAFLSGRHVTTTTRSAATGVGEVITLQAAPIEQNETVAPEATLIRGFPRTRLESRDVKTANRTATRPHGATALSRFVQW
jgi:hypothetical protein